MADENILTVALLAALGDAEAQLKYGVCFLVGKGVEKDPAKGIEWIQKAIDQGSEAAQRTLGNCYAAGMGVEKNNDKAIQLLLPFAQKGDVTIQNIVASAYAAKYFDSKSIYHYDEAMRWFQKAADNGDEEAKKTMIQLALVKAFDK